MRDLVDLAAAAARRQLDSDLDEQEPEVIRLASDQEEEVPRVKPLRRPNPNWTPVSSLRGERGATGTIVYHPDGRSWTFDWSTSVYTAQKWVTMELQGFSPQVIHKRLSLTHEPKRHVP